MKNNGKKKLLSAVLCIAAAASLVSSSGCKKNEPEPDTSSSAPVATAEQPAPQPIEEPDIGEHKDYDKEDADCYESGSILVADQDGTKRGMETYTMTLGTGCLEFYANELNQIKSDVGSKVSVYSMIVPTACELYCPKNARELIDSQEDIIKSVRDMLVDVKQVDVLPTLRNHNAENIYFRTDSRWTPLGAYYAGKAFAKAAGVPYADISEYTKNDERSFTGDLLNICGPQADGDLRAAPDSFIYYKPSVSFTTNYYDEQFTFLSADKFYFGDADASKNETDSESEEGYFGETQSSASDPFEDYYRGGFYCLRLDTKVKNDRKLLIVKDEFGTIMPPFLTSSFSQIFVVSYDYLEANLVEMIQEFGITDVLYLMNSYTITDTRVYSLETLRTQATHGSLEDKAPSDTDASDTDSSDSDSDKKKIPTDSDTESSNEPEYIYDVGINNQVGIVENSDEDNETYSTPDDNGGDYEDYGADAGYDDGGDYEEEW